MWELLPFNKYGSPQKIEGLVSFLKKRLRPIIEIGVRMVIPIFAPIFKWVARWGIGSHHCLKWGFLPMPVHFYSPVPDLVDLEQRKIWDRKSDLAGVSFNPGFQVAHLSELGKQFGHECDWPSQSLSKEGQFFTENGTFGFGCAASTYCILRNYKPRRVIEIGSGNSSKIISEALLLNSKDSMEPIDYSIIDPSPSPFIETGLSSLARLEKKPVETIDPSFFSQLERNDVLFIDSGHTVRMGGDVNFLILDILPRLSPGVIVHFHDIGLPNEYPKVYATNSRYRFFWTEAYLLQAFLCLNQEFEIMMALAFLMTERKKEFSLAFPHYQPEEHKSISGSFWIRRKMKRDL